MKRRYNQQSSLWKHLWQCIIRAGALSSLLALLSGIAGPLALVSTAQAAGLASNQLCTAAKRGLSLALPAVVRVTTTYQAQISYITSDGTYVTFPQNGGYYSLVFSGSGAFISANGDIVTAAHVVNVSQNDLSALLIQAAAPDIAQAIDDANPPQPVTTQDIENKLINDPNTWQGIYQTQQSAVYLSSQYAGSTNATSLDELQSFPVTTLAQFTSDQSDLTLLHVDGLKDMPTIPLGDSSQVFQGDTLTIIGYPGSADLTASDGTIMPNDFLTSSVNTVTVSAIKTEVSGLQVIQVGGNVEQGDSGGPALNADGQLVGVVSFANTSQDNQGETSFLQMVNNAKLMIHQAGIKTTQDAFDQRWAAAYDACASSASGHWHAAYQQYLQIARLYPDFKGVQLYLNYTKAQAAHEPAPGITLPAWALALIAVVVLALVLAIVLVIRRRRSRAGIGAYAGYGPGLNKETPYGTAAFSLGRQPGPTPTPVSTGPSEQVGSIPPPESAPLMPQPVSTAEPAGVWATTPTAPATTQADETGTVQPSP
jgi:S1-C subfamily serine protease